MKLQSGSPREGKMDKKLVIIGVTIAIPIIFFLFLNTYTKLDTVDNIHSFENTKRSFESGSYNIIINLPKEIYLKPEFYPSYNKSNEENHSKRALYGYGAYPSEVTYDAKEFKAGQEVDVYTLVHASYDVYTYQGMKLTLDSSNNEFFETQISPSEILLFPKYLENSSNVTSNWSYKIKITVSAKEDIPEGKYLFKLKADVPSPDKEAEFRQIDGKYVSGGFIHPLKFFDFILNIIGEVKQ